MNRVSGAGETAGRIMPATDIESVTLARDSGRRREIAISGDRGILKFGKGLPGRSLEFVAHRILAKIAEAERRGR